MRPMSKSANMTNTSEIVTDHEWAENVENAENIFMVRGCRSRSCVYECVNATVAYVSMMWHRVSLALLFHIVQS